MTGERAVDLEGELSTARVEAARAAATEAVHHTPLCDPRWLSEATGGDVALKAENLQRTGSFKIRGASEKLARLSARELRSGVVAASAGNHGQAVAYAAGARGAPCRVFMPETASVTKVEAIEGYGGEVVSGGQSVDECVQRALRFAEERSATFVHPFDDPAVLRGQATIAHELLEEVPEVATAVIPVGGGGLAGAAALALKRHRPEVRVVGVQLDECAPFLHHRPADDLRFRLADGIAIKRPGGLTRALIEGYVDELHAISEESIAEAMVLLMQRAKLVVEGAGAVGVAALLAGAVEPAPDGRTVVVLSGGNVDPGVIAAITRRHESRAGRRIQLLTRVPDHPGGLAGLLTTVADAGANVVFVEHLRDSAALGVHETGVELVLETRGHGHSVEVLRRLEDAGYAAVRGPSLDTA